MLAALAREPERPPVTILAVREIPLSGKPAELMHSARIDADAIVDTARRLAGVPA